MLVMRTYLLPFLLLATLVFTGCEESSLMGTEGTTPGSLNSLQGGAVSTLATQAIDGEYIVVLKDGVAFSEVGALAQEITGAYNGTVLTTFDRTLKGFAATLPATAVNAVSARDDVAYLEQNQVVYGSSVAVADTQTAAPWNLDRIDQRPLPLDGKYGYSLSGTGVTAFIIDSGIDADHPDFGGRAAITVDLVGDGQNGEDCHGHGTHVAGIIGGGTYGVAKDVTLEAIRVFDCNNAGTVVRVIQGLDVAVLNATGTDVVNLSMTGISSASLQTAVENTIAAGLPVVVAASDNSSDACFFAPANAPNALTVASTDIGDNRGSTSNFGDCIDLFAPGVNVTSTWLNGGTNTATGTSQAAPHVTGVAALYLEAEPTAPPTLAVTSVNDVILDHATPGEVSNPGVDSPNLLLFSDVPNNPRMFSMTLNSKIIKPNGKGQAVFSWNTGTVRTNQVDVYIDGNLQNTVPNDGSATLKFTDPVLSGPFDVQACETGSSLVCSNVIKVIFFYFRLKLQKVTINQSNEGVAKLSWKDNKVSKNRVDFYVNETPDGSFFERAVNDGIHKLRFDPHTNPPGPFEIRACAKNSTTICSNLVTADFTNATFEFEECRDCDEPIDDEADDEADAQ